MTTTGSIEHRGSKGEGDRTTRCQRGITLFRERGSEVVRYVDGTFGVPSRTEDGAIYHVDLERGTCQCADYLVEAVHRGNPYHVCLHQVCATIYAAKVATGETRRQHGPGSPRPVGRSRCSWKGAAA